MPIVSINDIEIAFVMIFIVGALFAFVAGIAINARTSSKKDDVTRKNFSDSDIDTVTRPRPNVVYNKPKVEKPSDPKQRTIYSFFQTQKMQSCPFCDGENNKEAKVCNICRRELNFEGVKGNVL